MKKFEHYSIHVRPDEDAALSLDCYGADGWDAFQALCTGVDLGVDLKREKP